MKLLTREEIAAAFGKHPITIIKWQRAGMPVAERGGRGVESKYNLADVVGWRVASELARHGVDNQGARNLEVERARQARANAERVEAENRRRRGELLERAVWVRTCGEHITHAKTRLLALPSVLAPRLVHAAQLGGPTAIQAVVDAAIREALSELAGAVPSETPA